MDDGREIRSAFMLHNLSTALTDAIPLTGFKVCDQMLEAYRLAIGGKSADDLKVRRYEIAECPGHYHNCPQSGTCRAALQEIEIAALETETEAQQFEPIAGKQRQGQLKQQKPGGGHPLQQFEDADGNHVKCQPLDHAYLHRYEAPGVLELLSLWQSKQHPSLRDLDMDRLSRSWVFEWMHVTDHDDGKIARFRHFAPGMIRFLGADFTGNSVMHVGAPALADYYKHQMESLRKDPQPIYARVHRKLNGLSSVEEANLRRLELPLYENREISGSIIVSIPE